MRVESFIGIPSSLRETLIRSATHAEKTEAERHTSYDLLEQTIFPENINELSNRTNSGFWLTSPYDIWKDISLNSAVLPLFSNLKHVEFKIDDDGMRDVYSASAISIEMLPTGILILRGGTDVSKSLLMPDEWRKSEKTQIEAFVKVLNNPKENVLYAVDVNAPPVYD